MEKKYRVMGLKTTPDVTNLKKDGSYTVKEWDELTEAISMEGCLSMIEGFSLDDQEIDAYKLHKAYKIELAGMLDVSGNENHAIEAKGQDGL